MAPPDLSARARGALLGLAAGNVLGVPAGFRSTRTGIQDRFPDGIRDVQRQDTPDSPYADDLALALILAEELLQPEVDLRRLARRWAEWGERDGRGMGRWTRQALQHLRQYDAPPVSTGGQAGTDTLARGLPVALRTFRQPANLVSATYHTAALTHPDDRCTWGAVAVNVAAGCFLEGRRDFVGDVIEALRENGAPLELLTAVRRVPLVRREELPVGGAGGHVVQGVEVGLWFAYHEPDLERGLIWLVNAGGDTETIAAVAGGLMGARDGVAAVPARWIDAVPAAERIAGLALGLAGL